MANKYANDNAQDAALDVIEEIFVEARKLEEGQSDITARLRDGAWTGRDVFKIQEAQKDTIRPDWIKLFYMHKNIRTVFTLKEKKTLGFETLSTLKKITEESVRETKAAIEALYAQGTIYGDTLCNEIVDYLADEKLPMPNFQQDEIYMLAKSYSTGSEAIHKASVTSQQNPKPKGLER